MLPMCPSTVMCSFSITPRSRTFGVKPQRHHQSAAWLIEQQASFEELASAPLSYLHWAWVYWQPTRTVSHSKYPPMRWQLAPVPSGHSTHVSQWNDIAMCHQRKSDLEFPLVVAAISQHFHIGRKEFWTFKLSLLDTCCHFTSLAPSCKLWSGGMVMIVVSCNCSVPVYGWAVTVYIMIVTTCLCCWNIHYDFNHLAVCGWVVHYDCSHLHVCGWTDPYYSGGLTLFSVCRWKSLPYRATSAVSSRRRRCQSLTTYRTVKHRYNQQPCVPHSNTWPMSQRKTKLSDLHFNVHPVMYLVLYIIN